jgi:hypothetical protein
MRAMSKDSHPAQIFLAHGQRLRLVDARGSTVSCHSGMLWITQHLDTRDFVLLPGQSMLLSRQGVTLVEAFRDTALGIAASCARGTGWLALDFPCSAPGAGPAMLPDAA